MDTPRKPVYPERNPKTHALHQREVFWQISLPLVIGILVLVAAVVAIVLSATQPVTDLGRWADVSLMWIILPSLFFALIMLAITIGLVIGVSLLLRIVPRYARILQLYFELGKGKVSQLTNLLAEPILRVKSIWASVRRAGRLGRKEAQE
jgi:uncharacterized membrane protein YhdT